MKPRKFTTEDTEKKNFSFFKSKDGIKRLIL